jgi:hypothetical protein
VCAARRNKINSINSQVIEIDQGGTCRIDRVGIVVSQRRADESLYFYLQTIMPRTGQVSGVQVEHGTSDLRRFSVSIVSHGCS